MCMIAKGTGIYQEEFVASFLSYLLTATWWKALFLCFVVEISGKRKIHFFDQLQGPRELLLTTFFSLFFF